VKIRRIVVGLDTAAHSRSALAAAAALAGELGAELEALFVESEEMHGLARLPFAREMGFPSAAMRPIDTAALERALGAHARAARRALTTLAERRPLRWSFRVARGSVPDELLAASGHADLTVLGVARWGPGDLRLARDAPTTLLVLPPSGRFRGPLAAICPVAVPPEQAFDLVASLATAVGDGFTILVAGDDLTVAGAWCEKAGELLLRQGSRGKLEIVRDSQPEALQAALERLAPRAVAIVAPPMTAQR
jgi:nucleotide-binding universal stress UspA family protein